MKIASFFALFLSLLFPPETNTQDQETAKVTQLTGSLKGECTPDSILLLELDGGLLKQVATTQLVKKGNVSNFSFTIPSDLEDGFYFVGTPPQNFRPILITKKDKIRLDGQCANIPQAGIAESKINLDYERTMRRVGAFNMKGQELIGQYRAIMQKGAAGSNELDEAFKQLNTDKIAFMDSLKKANPLLRKIAALNVYLNFQGGGEGYKDESIYFAEQFFQFVDFSDPFYNNVPGLHESMKVYSSNIARVNLLEMQQQKYIDEILNKMEKGSKAHKLSLMGVTFGFMDVNPSNFKHYATQYLRTYPNANAQISKQFTEKIASLTQIMIGAEAPDIEMAKPDGEMMKLSELRGKVVLIDFWASWCKPCRRENPKVKVLYDKYHKKGFEIFGVSLDRSKASWEKAIEQDGLNWHHVSDLKFWQNEAAVIYKVHSIPYTVLIDAEGKILAKQFRSEQLEFLLKEIFGE